ncbi:MAG TPA: SWIM zinc finger family protein, partial [Oscillatoriales cyanobacterium M59_W2019_021]|nr:SWIM zinc finger family protein [Oscillatoriales cyanobacterium M59_W2019_021]
REWWVQQWLDLLDKYRFKKRLERGRNYARQGNVLSIEFKGDKIISRVQGTEAEPYKQSLWLDTFTDEDWDCIIQTLSQQALFSAKLMAGEMPANIEDVFATNGLRLFPFSLSEIHSKCSCPDKANPCKHIVAVYHLLGDRFAEDPFVLFQLRGRTKEETIEALRQIRGEDPRSTSVPEIEPNLTSEQPIDLESFWKYDRQLESSLVVITPSPETHTILELLGEISIADSGKRTSQTRNSQALNDYFQQVYQIVSQTALRSAMETDS